MTSHYNVLILEYTSNSVEIIANSTKASNISDNEKRVQSRHNCLDKEIKRSNLFAVGSTQQRRIDNSIGVTYL